MKLISLASLGFVVASDSWEISFPENLSFDESDAGYKMFKVSEAKADAEANDMEYGIGSRGKVGTGSEAIHKMQYRKYDTLKKMILLLHDPEEREWGKYCPYGCHCMVNGPTDILSGHGHPIDGIDSACKRHQECITCAMKDFGADVCPWWKPYKMAAMVDNITNEKHFVCQDAMGYCKRSLCECDAQLARDLYEERKQYNRDNHHRYGSFSKDKCRAVNRGVYEETGSGNKSPAEHQCCGMNPKRFPYSPGKQDCCSNKLESVGTC